MSKRAAQLRLDTCNSQPRWGLAVLETQSQPQIVVKFKKAVIGIASERLAAAAFQRCPTTFWLPKTLTWVTMRQQRPGGLSPASGAVRLAQTESGAGIISRCRSSGHSANVLATTTQRFALSKQRDLELIL